MDTLMTDHKITPPEFTDVSISCSPENIIWGRIDPTPSKFVFQGNGKPVLTITREGELIFEDVTEAAQALMTEWKRMMGQS